MRWRETVFQSISITTREKGRSEFYSFFLILWRILFWDVFIMTPLQPSRYMRGTPSSHRQYLKDKQNIKRWFGFFSPLFYCSVGSHENCSWKMNELRKKKLFGYFSSLRSPGSLGSLNIGSSRLMINFRTDVDPSEICDWRSGKPEI